MALPSNSPKAWWWRPGPCRAVNPASNAGKASQMQEMEGSGGPSWDRQGQDNNRDRQGETITNGQIAINWANIAARVRICMNQVVLS